MNNKKIYSEEEFDSWAYRKGLIEAEKFLVSHYLDKNKKTLEAGTAGGRILFSLLEMGFTDLSGYDFVPEFIEQAKKRDADNKIQFSVGDATSLNYPDASFDQIIYLQQILSLINNRELSDKAVGESYRILKSGGVALFSFCDYNTRLRHPLYHFIVQYLKVFRLFSKNKKSIQYLPWFKLSGKPNIKLLLDSEPYNYWFTPKEAYDLLHKKGFKIIGMASQKQIIDKQIINDFNEFEKMEHSGMLYYICKK